MTLSNQRSGSASEQLHNILGYTTLTTETLLARILFVAAPLVWRAVLGFPSITFCPVSGAILIIYVAPFLMSARFEVPQRIN